MSLANLWEADFFPLKRQNRLVLVDRAMFRHRLFKQTFKPTNTMSDQTGTQGSAQAGIEDFNGILQKRVPARMAAFDVRAGIDRSVRRDLLLARERLPAGREQNGHHPDHLGQAAHLKMQVCRISSTP
jgi:hypothetical protein